MIHNFSIYRHRILYASDFETKYDISASETIRFVGILLMKQSAWIQKNEIFAIYFGMRILDLLKVSRPGLWLVFVWLYLWPMGGNIHMIDTGVFWLGLVYCTFPLNLLVYGMNDIVDEDVDAKNPRKGNFVYGANLPRKQLRQLPGWIALVNVLYLSSIAYVNPQLSFFLVKWIACAVAVNYAYNNEPFRLSRKCPYEVPVMIVGHFLIPWLSCQINSSPLPSSASWLFHALLLSRSHIWLEYEDISVDKLKGKNTIAVVVGERSTLTLIITLTAIEAAVGYYLLHSTVLAIFSLFGIVVFLVASSRKSSWKRPKTKPQSDSLPFVSISQSLVGVLLMIYLWRNRVFV